MHVLDHPWNVKENISLCVSNEDLLWQTNFLFATKFSSKFILNQFGSFQLLKMKKYIIKITMFLYLVLMCSWKYKMMIKYVPQ
jgi:hypothetical protein